MMRRAFLLFMAWAGITLQGLSAHSGISFVPNRGQWAQRFDYKADAKGATVFISSDKARVLLHPPDGRHHSKNRMKHGTPRGIAFDVAFLNAKPDRRPEAQALLGHRVHFIGPEGTVSTQPATAFQYPGNLPGGASLAWRTDGDFPAFDLHVPAHGDLALLGFRIRGVAFIQNQKGELHLRTPYGPVMITAPKAWQIQDGKKIPVSCRFQVQTRDSAITFRMGRDYNPALPLTIDPTLIFATYSASTANNWGNTATYGPNGTMFSGGIAFSAGFPATTGALDREHNGTVDIGILKYSSDGKRLLWATYLGGSLPETPHSLMADAAGRLYVLGTTSSANFPTTANAFDRTFNGGPSQAPFSFGPYTYSQGSDYIVSLLDSNGARLIGSTFLGGTDSDGLLEEPTSQNLTRNYGDQFRGEIALDARGRVCIGGTTLSADFPVRNGLGRTYQGNGDAIVARFSPNLDTLLSASFYGGSSRETGFGIAFDSTGNTYLTGGTQSSGLAGAVGTGYSGQSDGYLLALSPDWRTVQRTRYLGTAQYDQSYLVQTDRAGNVYAVGQTSGNWPVTAGTYSNTNGGQFLVSFSPGLATQRFSTRFGGDPGLAGPDLVLSAFLVDDCGKIYISGWGGEVNSGDYMGGFTDGLPLTANAHQDTTDGNDFYLMVLDRDATALHYATYFGLVDELATGEHVDGGTSRFDKKGVVYQAVCSCGSISFPTTPGVWGPENLSGGGCNNAGFKFDFSLLKARFFVDTLIGNRTGCVPFTVQLHNRSEFGQQYKWTFGTDTSSRSDTLFSYTFTQPGTFPITLRAINPDVCQQIDSTTVTLVAFSAKALEDTLYRLCDPGQVITFNNLEAPGYRYDWAPNDGLNDTLAAHPRARLETGAVYTCTINSPQGCTASRKVGVLDHRHTAQIMMTIPIPAPCAPYSMQPSLRSIGANDSLWWDYGDGFRLQTFTPPSHLYSRGGSYWVNVTAYGPDSLCQPVATDSLLFMVNGVDAYGDSVYRYCHPGDSLRLPNLVLPGYRYQWAPAGHLSSDTVAQPIFRGPGAGPGQYLVTVTSPEGCQTTRQVQVADGRLSVHLRTLFGPNLCLGSETPPFSVLNDQQSWEDIRWTINGRAHPDSANATGDPWEHFLGGLRMDTAGRYTIRIEVGSSASCQPTAADSASIAVGKTAIPGDTTLKLCPDDDYRLLAPMRDAMAVVRWLPVGGQLPEFTGRFTHEATLTAALTDTFGCSLSRNYRLERQRLSAQATVTPVYDPCNNRYTVTLETDPFPPANGAGWFYRGLILPRHAEETVPGSTLNDTAFMHLSLRQCSERVPFLVQAQNSPVVIKPFLFVDDFYTQCGEYASLHAFNLTDLTQCPGCTFVWALPDGSTRPGGQKTVFQPTEPVNTIKLIATSGPCIAEVSETRRVHKMEVTNVITPNDDGQNEHIVKELDSLPLDIDIYNRNGQHIYSGSGHNWPKPETPAGTYYYHIKAAANPHACKGWVEVVR